MTTINEMRRKLDETRDALRAPFSKAKAAGDEGEMARLRAIAADLDSDRRQLDLASLIGIGKPIAGTVARTAEEAPQEPEAAAPTVAAAAPGGAIAWGAVTNEKHGPTFRDKVIAIAGRLDCDPNHLMAVMAFETGESFEPDQTNAAGSGATGLIQFMPKTARGLGTTTAKLARMSAVGQLDFVEAHFRSVAGGRQLASLSDVYMAVLLPSAIGRLDSHALFTKPSKAYDQNRGLDVNRDGTVTRGEATAKVARMLFRGLKAGRIG